MTIGVSQCHRPRRHPPTLAWAAAASPWPASRPPEGRHVRPRGFDAPPAAGDALGEGGACLVQPLTHLTRSPVRRSSRRMSCLPAIRSKRCSHPRGRWR